MNLAIDIGNSLAKLAVIENGQVVDFLKTDRPDAAFVAGVLDANPAIDAAIAISCRTADSEVETGKAYILSTLDGSVPVPIENRYATPETLGPDRLAAAVGAWTLYPGRNILIVDFGTAITIDFVTERGEYLGGNISPGADTRFRALNRFTDTLPLCSFPQQEKPTLLGDSTRSAIESGVVNGIVYEIEGYIRDLEQRYEDLRIVFTGGESDFFAKRLKNTIFATYDLVAYGLNRILEYNAK